MALSNNTTNSVLHALKTLMTTQGQCFTTHDVTKAAQSLTDEPIDHNDVKEVIHNLYDQKFLTGFTRVNHIVTDGKPAQLFVPSGANPYTYSPNEVVMPKPPASADKKDLDQMIGYTGIFVVNDAAKQIIPPVNLGGQVTLSGGRGGAQTPTPTPTPTSLTPKLPVDPDSYLNNWNKPETRASSAEEQGILAKIKAVITAKLKDLLS